VGFVAGGFFGDAGAEDFGLGLEIDDQIGSGNVRGERLVIALVELELGVVEIEIGEDAVLFHEEIGENGAGASTARASRRRFWRSMRKYIWARRRSRVCFIEVGEEGIVLAIVDTACMQALGEDAGKSGFADAQGPSITMKRGSCGLRCGTRARLAAEESLPGIVSFDRARLGRGQQVDYSRVAARVSACLTARRRWESARPGQKCRNIFTFWPSTAV